MELAVVEVEKEVKGRRDVVGWLDALPYVDSEMGVAGMRARAELMVKEELKRHPGRREPLPEVEKMDLARAPLAAMELERIEADLPSEEISLSIRGAHVPPASKQSEPEAWQVFILP